MHKIVDETLLTRFAATMGDSALISLTSSIYASGIFKFLLLCFFSFSIVSLGLGIHRRQISQRALYAAFAFILAYPSQGRPIVYRIINAFSQTTSLAFQNGINAFISNDKKDNLPPGMAMEMLIASASSKLKSDESRALFYGFVMNCLPNALTKTGEKAKFDDLFKFHIKYGKKDDTTGEVTVNFVEQSLNDIALRNDNSFNQVLDKKNCNEGLDLMRRSMLRDQKGEPFYISDRVVEGTEEDPKSVKKWVDDWKAKSPQFMNLAMNLRLAQAAEYEKSRIIQDHGGGLSDLSGEWWQGTGTDKSLRELLIAMDGTTTAGYVTSDIKSMAANMMENRWSFSLGAAIKDLKERLELLPYQLAAIKLLLKILLPLVMMTMFLGTFKFLFMWAGAWFVASLTPCIINASRSINNSLLLAKLGIQDLTTFEGTKALSVGVDLAASKQLLSDFTPLAYAMIEQEKDIIRYLAGSMLVGSWLAGGGANGFVSWMSNAAQGFMTSSSIGGAVSLSSTVMGSSIKAASPHMNSAAHSMGQRTRSLVDTVRGEMPPARSKMHPISSSNPVRRG